MKGNKVEEIKENSLGDAQKIQRTAEQADRIKGYIHN